MNSILQDLRFGLRMLLKKPGFSVVAVLTLAIGIGANITLFSVIHAVLLKPLPFGDPGRLVVVQQQSKRHGWTTGFSYPDFQDWKEQGQVFESFAAFTQAEFDLVDKHGGQKIKGAAVTEDFFSLLKMPPLMGRILGVAADIVQGNVRNEKLNHLFFPFDSKFIGPDLVIVMRTESESAAVIGQIREIVREIDPSLPVFKVSAFKAQMNKCVSQERLVALFLIIFASIAVFLVVIGIYGVVSYAAVQRTNEIGIRMALGAQQTSILAMILKQGLILSAIGSVLGIAGAFGLTRFLKSYLYEISTVDTLSYILGPLLVTGVGILACYLPARRAAKTDPMVALRYEE